MDALTWVTPSPDGQLLAVGSESGRVTLWSLPRGEVDFTFETGEYVVRARWTADGQRIVIATTDGHLLVRNPDCRERLGEIDTRHGRLRDFAMNGDGTAWATCGEDGAVRLWDAQTLAARFALVDGEVAAIAVGFAHESVVAGYQDGFFVAWRDDGSEKLASGNIARWPPIYSLAVHPSGKRIVFGGGRGAMQEVIVGPPDDWRAGHQWKDTPPKPIAVNALTFAPDGRFLAAFSDDTANLFQNTSEGWGRSLGEPFYLRKPKPEWSQSFIVSGCCFVPNSDLIATSHFNGNLRIWRGDRFPQLEETIPLG